MISSPCFWPLKQYLCRGSNWPLYMPSFFSHNCFVKALLTCYTLSTVLLTYLGQFWEAPETRLSGERVLPVDHKLLWIDSFLLFLSDYYSHAGVGLTGTQDSIFFPKTFVWIHINDLKSSKR